MHQVEGTVLLSPTDLTKHLACRHLTTLDLAYARGESQVRPDTPDEMLELIFAKGQDHEYAYRDKLRRDGRTVREIPTRHDLEGRRAAEAETLQAMREGVDVIYQACFFDGRWGGQADFLLRTQGTSKLGPWLYDIADTKLARRLKVPALLQMAAYAERLEVLQGEPPKVLVVVTGDGAERTWRLVDVQAYARRARARLARAVDHPELTLAVPVQHCGQCRWASHCEQEWQRTDDLSLVAGMRSVHREVLIGQGVPTLAALATTPPDAVAGISRGVRDRLTQQARLQLAERSTGTPAYELLSPAPGQGLLRLPEPSPGDVYLDFEGDPFADGGPREYLAGLWDRDGQFHSWWAHSRQQEGEMVGALLRDLVARLDADPGMHVYHYAQYEPSALKRMSGRHGVGERDLDRLLRGERLVDLYAVVKQGVRISKDSYSIKKLEAFYWGATRGGTGAEVESAMSSVVAYERWLAEPDPAILEQIAAYNRDDVRSTHDLHRWLEGLREELQSTYGLLGRPSAAADQPSAEQSEVELAEEALAARLRLAGHPLMAGLVGWHRRELRPAWWEYFRGSSLDDEQLVEDRGFVGGLSGPQQVGSVARSHVYRYTFPPQEGRLKVGDQAHDVDLRAPAGEVTAFDAAAGYLEVKRGMRSAPLPARGLGPPKPMPTDVLAGAIHRLGESVLRGELSTGRALVERRVPDDLRGQLGEEPADTVRRIGRELSKVRNLGRVLAVQGPPGSGKTYTAAQLVQALLDDGRTVGVTANSHSVIGHLLRTVGRSALQKCKPEQHCQLEQVEQTDENSDVLDALRCGRHRLVGGTSWLWARPELAGAVDVLLIDEAGQFSLANAAAVSSAARALVLLGDPQQLAAPTQADHPDGSGVSALQHLIEDKDTIAVDRGIFLDTTRRMHPDVTGFVGSLSYDGRLRPISGLERQCVTASAGRPLPVPDGSGLRFVPVRHTGCSSSSVQEARVVADLYPRLLGCTITGADRPAQPMTSADILVIAPYNAHVALLRSALPEGARVGTVDAFQGQEAAVVVYSLASSSEADAPRGVGFLYDVHRLNVAVSRAQAMCVLVSSPALLDAPVHEPDQLKAVNALCRYVELAKAQQLLAG